MLLLKERKKDKTNKQWYTKHHQHTGSEEVKPYCLISGKNKS
jgi:hypothetical protein